jgi:hypothetical protein
MRRGRDDRVAQRAPGSGRGRPSGGCYTRCRVYTYAEVNRVMDAFEGGQQRTDQRGHPQDQRRFPLLPRVRRPAPAARDGPRRARLRQPALPPKAGLPARRVFIGECGLSWRPAAATARSMRQRNREILAKFLSWRPAPSSLATVNNEVKDGQVGFWLIDDQKRPTPLHRHPPRPARPAGRGGQGDDAAVAPAPLLRGDGHLLRELAQPARSLTGPGLEVPPTPPRLTPCATPSASRPSALSSSASRRPSPGAARGRRRPRRPHLRRRSGLRPHYNPPRRSPWCVRGRHRWLPGVALRVGPAHRRPRRRGRSRPSRGHDPERTAAAALRDRRPGLRGRLPRASRNSSAPT